MSAIANVSTNKCNDSMLYIEGGLYMDRGKMWMIDMVYCNGLSHASMKSSKSQFLLGKWASKRPRRPMVYSSSWKADVAI